MAYPSASTVALAVLLVGALALVGGAIVLGMPLDGGDGPGDGLVYHADPGEYGADGDLDAVQAWLALWLDSQLSDSLIEISDGEAEMARERLGDEYTERLRQYIEVADDEDGADAYEEAREDHDRVAELMDEYNETWEAYEAAIVRGDVEEAHELAREINRLADEIEAISDRILERVAVVPLRPDAVDALERTKENVSNESEQVRKTHFTETALVLEAVDEPVSFLEPPAIEGVLETVDGEPIANESVVFEVDGQAVSAETDEDGGFVVGYRPVDLALDDSVVEVAYVPDGASAFLGSVDSVELDLQQVEPTLTVAIDQEVAGFGESIDVSGELGVDGEAVDGVTLEVSVGGEVLGAVRVVDGAFDGAVDVPAAVEAGESALVLRLPFEGQALAGGIEEVPITVVETETSMSLEAAVDEDAGVIDLSGELITVDGQAVADQPVSLDVGDGPVVVAETGGDGGFSTAMDIDAVADENVTIIATFDGTGTNLVGSQADTVVVIDTATGLSTSWLFALGVLLVVTLAGTGWWYRRRASGVDDAPGEVEIDQPTSVTPSDTPTVADALLDAAIDRYSDESFDEAVVLGYGAMRLGLAGHLEDGRGYTHWEFLDAMAAVARENGLSEIDIERLETVTTAFERASFQVDPVSVEEATAVLDASREVVRHTPRGRRSVLGDD